MNVSVGKEFEDFVKNKVASGDYASVSEVVRDGLRLLKERDLIFEAKLQALRGEIQKGVDQAVAGDLLDGPEVMAEFRNRLLDREPALQRETARGEADVAAGDGAPLAEVMQDADKVLRGDSSAD